MPRNLMGFKDGSRNLSGDDAAAMEQFVWVGDEGPESMRGGSYVVLRRIRIALERWDRMPRDFQEHTFGREKSSGAPLGAEGELDPPDLKAMADEGDPVIPDSAHIRIAAPESNDGARILRRGYSYNDGMTFVRDRWPPWREGPRYDAGLFFVCYQRDPRTGFIPIFDRLSKFDMLNQFVTHTGGGLFACPAAPRRAIYRPAPFRGGLSETYVGNPRYRCGTRRMSCTRSGGTWPTPSPRRVSESTSPPKRASIAPTIWSWRPTAANRCATSSGTSFASSLPFALAHHRVELVAEVFEPVHRQHRVIGRGRAVKGDTLAHPFEALGHGGVVGAGGEKAAAGNLVISRESRPDLARPASIRGMIASVRYLRVQKPCSLTPSHSSAATFSIAGPTAAIITAGAGAVDRRRREVRRHQGEAVMLALVGGLLAGLPAAPDRAQHLDVFAHARRRRRPRHREAPLVVAAHLRAQPDHEAAAGRAGEIPADFGHRHRGAGERRSRRRCASSTRSVAAPATASARNGSCWFSIAMMPS